MLVGWWHGTVACTRGGFYWHINSEAHSYHIIFPKEISPIIRYINLIMIRLWISDACVYFIVIIKMVFIFFVSNFLSKFLSYVIITPSFFSRLTVTVTLHRKLIS